MAETLGSLVDKLSICNIKLFMVQDVVNEAARSGDGIDAETVRKLATLNAQRNGLMTEIDQALSDAADGKARIEQRIKV